MHIITFQLGCLLPGAYSHSLTTTHLAPEKLQLNVVHSMLLGGAQSFFVWWGCILYVILLLFFGNPEKKQKNNITVLCSYTSRIRMCYVNALPHKDNNPVAYTGLIDA